ncbi:hypothetical protein QX233_09880 [Chryseobacterium gambrini]|uniref:Uncharacterized protein n=1 Tax=Chryseobacterium gambrini TaxID=373672 RepID=A0AAJ1VJ98_9FLAO|nr:MULTISPECIES: hypothetical protein [Chryseobacterium]MDN4012770.1 hypothetical protein [Chryseobacterium gambrini]MDN4030346.1 hypothetical protein [Chryseobacterium gambrini]QWA39370.1 hypothetical protein KKI44_03930 [Chryseobacterium sp. ZHDP1]
MVSLYTLSKLSSDRTSSRVKNSSDKAPDFLAIYSNKENATFQDRLIDACQKSHDDPKGVDELLFIAIPERLIAKLIYMSIGKPTDKPYLELSSNFSTDSLNLLELIRKEDEQVEFYNIKTSEQIKKAETILLCGGLSPVDDSIALLCEFGRAYRVSKILKKPIRVMLADSEWMSSNKTIRQFKTLNETQINEGLDKCRDRKGKLYSKFGFEVDLRQIVHFERKDFINSEKLAKISKYYLELSKTLWGEKAIGKRLDHNLVSIISKPLNNITFLDKELLDLLPEHIRVLSQFPSVLGAIEKQLNDHLQILRTIAKQFNIFDENTFSYFFAQYFAQDKYKGKVLKIAPISESKFDKPFNDLDKYFKTWGEGHTTKDLLSDEKSLNQFFNEERISSIYSPQYQIGKYRVLPYTPLSLDFGSKDEKNHEHLYDEIILIDRVQESKLVQEIIKMTPVLQRNKIFSDLIWFVILATEQLGIEVINNLLKSNNKPTINAQLNKFSEKLKNNFEKDLKYAINGQINDLWKIWFRKIQEDSKDTYLPSHLHFHLLDESDWNENAFEFATGFVESTILIYNKIIS